MRGIHESNFLNEGVKTTTLNQLVIREATYNRKWGIQKWSVPIPMLSSAKNQEVWDMQNPQPKQSLGTRGGWEREVEKEGDGSL